jgi:hypothetical protein
MSYSFDRDKLHHEPYYDVAQVCLGGHMVNYHCGQRPQHNKAFCPKCGKATIKECPKCQGAIQGDYVVPDSSAVLIGAPTPERGEPFCHACGAGYPWTVEAVESAQLLAEAIDMLQPEDQEALAKLIPDLVYEGPRTAAATVRFSSLVAKAGEQVPGLMRDLLLDVAALSVRHALWGP